LDLSSDLDTLSDTFLSSVQSSVDTSSRNYSSAYHNFNNSTKRGSRAITVTIIHYTLFALKIRSHCYTSATFFDELFTFFVFCVLFFVLFVQDGLAYSASLVERQRNLAKSAIQAYFEACEFHQARDDKHNNIPCTTEFDSDDDGDVEKPQQRVLAKNH